MRNMERRKTKLGVDDAGINCLLANARLEERRGRADVMSARLEKLAMHITQRQLGAAEVAELLRQEAEKMQREAWEAH